MSAACQKANFAHVLNFLLFSSIRLTRSYVYQYCMMLTRTSILLQEKKIEEELGVWMVWIVCISINTFKCPCWCCSDKIPFNSLSL